MSTLRKVEVITSLQGSGDRNAPPPVVGSIGAAGEMQLAAARSGASRLPRRLGHRLAAFRRKAGNSFRVCPRGKIRRNLWGCRRRYPV